MNRTLLAVSAALLSAPVFGQVYKCTVNGATAYQSQPCAGAGTGPTQPIKLHVSKEIAAPFVPASSPPVPAATQPAQPPATPPPIAPSKSWVELEGDACMEWYRPRLRDPRSAYYRDPQKEKSVITITIYATNGLGGFVSKDAACEIKSGEVDSGWTKYHADRLKWN